VALYSSLEVVKSVDKCACVHVVFQFFLIADSFKILVDDLVQKRSYTANTHEVICRAHAPDFFDCDACEPPALPALPPDGAAG
jgi:hypothetical protein